MLLRGGEFVFVWVVHAHRLLGLELEGGADYDPLPLP